MKILVLSQLRGSPGTRTFLNAAREAGHDVELRSPLTMKVDVGGGLPRLAGEAQARPDVVFTRMGSATPDVGFDVLEQFEAAEVPCVNRSAGLRTARDKIRCGLALARAGIPLPETVFGGPECDTAELIATLGPPPWILKRPIGTKGVGVLRVDSLESLPGVVDLLRSNGERFLLQRFVPEAARSDIRVLVVGGRAVGAMRRSARAGELRSNLHQGGRAESFELDSVVTELAERSATCLDLDVAGVDLIGSDAGYLVLEVNGSPGLAGIESVAGSGVVRAVVDEVVSCGNGLGGGRGRGGWLGGGEGRGDVRHREGHLRWWLSPVRTTRARVVGRAGGRRPH